MLAVCEKHAPQHSRLQSRNELRGFRANVSPLATHVYTSVYTSAKQTSSFFLLVNPEFNLSPSGLPLVREDLVQGQVLCNLANTAATSASVPRKLGEAPLQHYGYPGCPVQEQLARYGNHGHGKFQQSSETRTVCAQC